MFSAKLVSDYFQSQNYQHCNIYSTEVIPGKFARHSVLEWKRINYIAADKNFQLLKRIGRCFKLGVNCGYTCIYL